MLVRRNMIGGIGTRDCERANVKGFCLAYRGGLAGFLCNLPRAKEAKPPQAQAGEDEESSAETAQEGGLVYRGDLCLADVKGDDHALGRENPALPESNSLSKYN